ncbi:high frequency lysogenization protein HflD [Thiohalorhabdus sp.]|uniref:high frequency lysogenization protein HflD n=1 Tax=Thiohalorhabdus sp. TaxID=3094134 RepID=UPI002FC36813
MPDSTSPPSADSSGSGQRTDATERRALALAGVFQAAGLVQENARKGTISHETARDASIASVFVTDPESVANVYGGLSGVRLGLTLLRDQLRGPQTGRQQADLELARYVIGLTALERKLSAKPGGLGQLGEGIEAARRTFDHFGPDHPNVANRLADIYSEHVSALGPRIVVRGESDILSDPDQVARVRALLLAGLRSAVLWRQQGGRRWHLLLARGRYQAAAERLLSELTL